MVSQRCLITPHQNTLPAGHWNCDTVTEISRELSPRHPSSPVGFPPDDLGSPLQPRTKPTNSAELERLDCRLIFSPQPTNFDGRGLLPRLTGRGWGGVRVCALQRGLPSHSRLRAGRRRFPPKGRWGGPELAAEPHGREEPGAAPRFRPGGGDLSGRDSAFCPGGKRVRERPAAAAAPPCARQVREGRRGERGAGGGARAGGGGGRAREGGRGCEGGRAPGRWNQPSARGREAAPARPPCRGRDGPGGWADKQTEGQRCQPSISPSPARVGLAG